MASEKYRIFIDFHVKYVQTPGGWYLQGDNQFSGIKSQIYQNWEDAMTEAIRIGVGRKTSESGTYTLDLGVEIKAVKNAT